MAVGAGAGDDPVLGGEPLGLLVERGQRHPGIEDLEDVDLLDHVEQVLVVGHRVQPVERVRDVDEAALAADLGDRLGHRHPALDLLLDEEADHLALLGGLHLLGDDHLDPELVGDLARGERAGDLVVVGDRDRSEPGARGRSRAASRPVSRSRRSGRCACAGRRGSRGGARPCGAAPGCRAGSWRRAARRRVDRARTGRRPRQRADGPRGPRGAGRAEPGSATSRWSWPARVTASPGGKSRPELAVAGELRVGVDLERDRNRPVREGRADQTRARSADRRSRRRATSAPAISRSGGHRRRRRPGAPGRAASARSAARRRSAIQTAASQPGLLESRRSARRKIRRAPALLGGAVGDPQRPLARRALGRPPRLRRVGAGLDQLVVAGEEALEQRRGRARGDGAGVEAAEEDLDQRPRNLGRERFARSARGSCRRSATASGGAPPTTRLGANGS